jgi:hypothetical protein
VAAIWFRSSSGADVEAARNRVTLSDNGWTVSDTMAYAGEGVYFNGQQLDAEPAAGYSRYFGAYGAGVSGYGLGPDVYLVDLLGLGDSFTAHLEIRRRALAGHEKPLPPPWFIARMTAPGADLDEDDFPFPVVFSTQLGDPQGESLETRAAVARTTLRCPELVDLTDSYGAPLTLGRFFDNLWHAPARTALRIPPEPRDAAARFCDD